MAVDSSTIRTRLPEFADTTDPTDALIDTALAAAVACINRVEWGANRADEGTIWLTGHFILVMQKGSALASGPVTSEREGDLAASYGVGESFQNSVYGTTVYGRQYLELRRTAFPNRFEC